MTTIRRLLPSLALTLATFLLAAVPCRAALIVSTTNTVASQGSSGFLEVLLTNTDSFDRTLSAFSLDFTLGAGVSITAVDDQTTDPYVFGTDGTGTLVFDPLPASTVLISDLNLVGFSTIGANQTVGLARVAYAVASNAPIGPVEVSFTPGDGTIFVSGSGAEYPSTVLSLQPGTFEVTRGGNPVIPEPASFIGLTVGLAGVGAGAMSRSSRRLARRAAARA